MDAPVIERELDIDLPADELWDLISTADGWRLWLVDHADVVVREGSTGNVVDDGVRRSVAIERVESGQVCFVWSAGDGEVSRVSLTIHIPAGNDTSSRPRLRITEEWLAPAACAACPLRAEGRWELRECLLSLCALAACRV